MLLGEASVPEALPVASSRLAAALGLPYAAIVLEPAETPERRTALALDVGARSLRRRCRSPRGLPADAVQRLRERIAPALQALLAAALDRDRLQAEVVETQALRRSDVIKTALLRAVSHDLRTPLTAILAAGEALRSPSLDARERDELGSVVVEEARPPLAADRQAARPLAAAGGRGRAAAATGARSRRSSQAAARAASATAAWPSRSRSTATCRWCGPTPPSSSACSRTCSRTRGATPAGTRSRSAPG